MSKALTEDYMYFGITWVVRQVRISFQTYDSSRKKYVMLTGMDPHKGTLRLQRIPGGKLETRGFLRSAKCLVLLLKYVY